MVGKTNAESLAGLGDLQRFKIFDPVEGSFSTFRAQNRKLFGNFGSRLYWDLLRALDANNAA